MFVVLQKHKEHNRPKVIKKASQSGAVYSTHEVRREVNRAAKVIKNMPTLTEKRRNLALKRL